MFIVHVVDVIQDSTFKLQQKIIIFCKREN